MYQGTLLEFLNMGGGEIILIMVAVLLMFGGKKLPELARGLGKGIREFKDASEGVKREIHRNINAMDIDESAPINNEIHHPTETNTFEYNTEAEVEQSLKEDEEEQTVEAKTVEEKAPTRTVIDDKFVNENHKV